MNFNNEVGPAAGPPNTAGGPRALKTETPSLSDVRADLKIQAKEPFKDIGTWSSIMTGFWSFSDKSADMTDRLTAGSLDHGLTPEPVFRPEAIR